MIKYLAIELAVVSPCYSSVEEQGLLNLRIAPCVSESVSENTKLENTQSDNTRLENTRSN